MSKQFIVSSSPHLGAAESTADIMRWVCVALAPAFGVALYNFGARALFIAVVAVAACVGAEYVVVKMRGVKPTLGDFSAVVSGLLLAATLPPNVAWWLPVIGGIFAMGIVKHAFGGLGSNIWNPALAARALLQVSFPTQLNSPIYPRITNDSLPLWDRVKIWLIGDFSSYADHSLEEMQNLQQALSEWAPEAIFALPNLTTPADVIATATPLTAMKAAAAAAPAESLGAIFGADYWEMIKNTFIGLEGGAIAETSAIALALGGLFLLAKKIITWEAPVVYLLTVGLLGYILPAPYALGADAAYTPGFSGSILLHLGAGGVMLAAFFMDTDYVTTPLTRRGKIIFAAGCGIITALIRLYSSSYPEGCCYSILIMNTCVPLIDSWTRPRKSGAV
jgi:electron transport complex protein RnfD